jgi:phospholipid transport system substrate-binding protein
MPHSVSKRASVGRAVSRRSLLRTVILGAVAAALLPRPAAAQLAGADAAAPVQRLTAALLAIMKSGQRTSFQQRFEMLVPVVEQTFDLQAVLTLSVGPRWASLSADEQARLMTAFRRYTVANYVANFDAFSGQSFVVSPDARSLANGDRIVQTTIGSPGEAGHTLGYVMRQTPSGWKAVDVLADGAISRVAVHRSDFRNVLASGGGAALVTTLERKASDLSGGRA